MRVRRSTLPLAVHVSLQTAASAKARAYY